MSKNKDIIPATACSRQLFGMDLKKVIDQKVVADHQIIVIGDFNSEYEDLQKLDVRLVFLDNSTKTRKGVKII